MTKLGPRRRSGRSEGEKGQTSLLIVGLAVVVVMLVVVVVDASAAYLRRQGLDTLADGAALAAADGIEGEQVYTGGLGEHAGIDPVVAEGLVADYLASAGVARRYPGLTYRVRVQADRVVVDLGTPLDLPLTLPGVRDAVVSSRAAAMVRVAP